jgi:hypothetical protein
MEACLLAGIMQGTGTAEEMALEERTTIATEGCVIADVAVLRPPMPPIQVQTSTSGRPAAATAGSTGPPDGQEAAGQGPPPRLRAHVRVKTLAMWSDQGRLGQELCRVRISVRDLSAHSMIQTHCEQPVRSLNLVPVLQLRQPEIHICAIRITR